VGVLMLREEHQQGTTTAVFRTDSVDDHSRSLLGGCDLV
jgi:hypothetical protein